MRRLSLMLVSALMALTASAQTRFSIDQVHQSWTTMSIPAAKQNGGIIQLVEAFNKAWPTYSVTEFLKDAKRPADHQQWIITVDRLNGFVSFAEGSDDQASEVMQACVWKRSDGHKLFAVAFMQHASEVRAFTAFYDYDPATGILRPQQALADLFTPNEPKGFITISLPQHGKDMKVQEYFINAGRGITHIYPWDGMKPGRERVEIEDIQQMWNTYQDQAMMDGEQPVSRYALIDIDRDGSPELMLGSEDDDYQAVYALYDGQWQMIAAKDYKRQLNFFPPKAVGSSGGCGTGCFYIDWTLLENSRPKHHIENSQEYNFQDDKMVDNYSLDGREIVHAEEGNRLVKSFGESVEMTIDWRPLNR
ncbi:MAG: hypothetical protein IJ067_01795 [Prevotella sp.]|nr:hypothetical protein [Prevotella sp.]